MAGGDVETVAAGSPQALVSGPRLGYRCAPVGDVDEHGGCGGPLCQHHHGRELPQWTAFYLLPFGIYGMIAFVWFLVAGLRVLHRNWKFGNSSLQNVNAMLFAAFSSRALAFFLVFGSLNSAIPFFTGLLGLGIALKRAEPARAQAEQPATGVEFGTEYIKA